MRRASVVVTVIFICILNSSCISDSERVKGTIAGAEVTVDSLKRMQEFRPAGSGTGFGQPRPFQADKGNELAVIGLKADKKFGDQGVMATVKDVKDQIYKSIFKQVFEFKDQHVEATILFEVPQGTVLKTLILDETTFDLSKLKNENK